MKRKSALMSVFNKRQLDQIGPTLQELGYAIIASSGTAGALKEVGVESTPADAATGNPKAFQDCIQTLSFSIYAGILFDRINKRHIKQIEDLVIRPIDVVICNLPPLQEMVQNEQDFNIRHVDVGGPLMLRAAATNYQWVLPLSDPDDYSEAAELLSDNKLTIEFRRRMAAKAFDLCSTYDAEITKLLKTF